MLEFFPRVTIDHALNHILNFIMIIAHISILIILALSLDECDDGAYQLVTVPGISFVCLR